MPRKTEEERLTQEGWVERYERVIESLTQEERDDIKDQREKGRAGERAHYGHDMVAAVHRGHMNKSIEAAHVCLQQAGLRDAYGQDHDVQPRVKFGLALDALIYAAADIGVLAEEVRWTLENQLKSNDAGKIEKMMERRSGTKEG